MKNVTSDVVTMTKNVLLTSIIIISSLMLIMILVNEFSPPPTNNYSPDYCTRYCHDRGDRHTAVDSWAKKPFEATVAGLKNNALGLTYQQINILVFVILWPLLMLALLIWVIKNTITLRKLRHG